MTRRDFLYHCKRRIFDGFFKCGFKGTLRWNILEQHSDYRAHTAPLFSKLKILDIFQINTLDIAKFMFRYHNNLLPPLYLNLLMTNSQVHTYDTRTAGNYRMHSCRTNIKKFTILYQGPRVWNCLPASITNLPSFSTFKNKVLEFLLK